MLSSLPPGCDECGYVRDLLADLETRLRREMDGQRETEQALLRSRDALEAFMDAVGESALLLAADGTVRAVNRTVCQRLDRAPGDLVGSSA